MHTRSLVLLFVVTSSAWLPAAEPPPSKAPAAPKGDAKVILGTWTLSNDEYVGANNTDWLQASRRNPAWEWAVTADKITFDGESAVTYLVDTTQDPKTIDIAGLHPKYPDQVTRGIFKLDGDRLIVCVAKGGSKERPTDFSPKAPAARRYEFERKGAKPLSPKAILEQKFEGQATVEFLVGEVTTVNIDSMSVPDVSHAQFIKAKVPGSKDGQAFFVILSREVATRLLHLGIDDPAGHLGGKVVRVSGVVERHAEMQYGIRVTELDQLERIRKP